MFNADMQAAVDNAAAKYGAAGIQAAVVRAGVASETYFTGWAVKDVQPMTQDTKLRSASISKVAIAIELMLLQEEGKLSLLDPLSQHWGAPVQNPNHPEVPITLQTCLTHTTTILPFDFNISRAYEASVQQLLRPESYTMETPGTQMAWAYNNYVFSVLGMALERTSGTYLDLFLNANLWDPLEADAAFEGGELRDTAHIATLYQQDGSVGLSADVQRTFKRPLVPASTGINFAGGLTASAGDLAKMAAVLSNEGAYSGRQILTPASVATLRQGQFPVQGVFLQAQPLRVQNNLFQRQTICYHSGSAYGGLHLLSFDPDTGDGAVVLTSGAANPMDDSGLYAVCTEISEAFYQILAGSRQ